MARLDGKVAVITGGASGIGEGTVRLFAEEGARVVIADIQEGRGQALAEELGATTAYLQTDVSQEAGIAAAVQYAVSKWGRLDCMFNNAGFGGVSGPIELTDMDGYDRTMAVLLRAVVAGMKHAAAVMKPQGSGSIIRSQLRAMMRRRVVAAAEGSTGAPDSAASVATPGAATRRGPRGPSGVIATISPRRSTRSSSMIPEVPPRELEA